MMCLFLACIEENIFLLKIENNNTYKERNNLAKLRPSKNIAKINIPSTCRPSFPQLLTRNGIDSAVLRLVTTCRFFEFN